MFIVFVLVDNGLEFKLGRGSHSDALPISNVSFWVTIFKTFYAVEIISSMNRYPTFCMFFPDYSLDSIIRRPFVL